MISENFSTQKLQPYKNGTKNGGHLVKNHLEIARIKSLQFR